MFGTFGVQAAGMLIITIIFLMFDLEKKLPQIHAEIRQKEGNEEDNTIEMIEETIDETIDDMTDTEQK